MEPQEFANEIVRELEGYIMDRIEGEGLSDDAADEVWDAINRIVRDNGIG